MAVFLTGDTHGSMDFAKIRAFDAAASAPTRDDVLIILGDFGLVWSSPASAEERDLLDWLDSRPWTTLFLDGNHENFDRLDALPAEELFGGRVQRVRENVIHLMRGERYEIGGRSFFVCGGGHSIERDWRIPHASWWPQEVPGAAERDRIAAAARTAGRVDYVLTHCPPTGQYERYRARWSGFWGPSDEYTDWLEEHIEGVVPYTRWYFGHLHFDSDVDDPHIAVFNEIVRL